MPCTRYSSTVSPAGGVQLSVYVPGCGPLDATCRLVGPGMLGVVVPVGVTAAVVTVAAGALGVAAVPIGVGLRAGPVGVLVGVVVAVGTPLGP
jgi:hypothetical protein